MSTPMRRRLLLIFGLTILAPGVVLGFLGVQALIQQSRLAGEEVHERLNVASENAGRRIEIELHNWQEALDDIVRSGVNDPIRWPERVRTAIATPGAAVVFLGPRGREEAIPAEQ